MWRGKSKPEELEDINWETFHLRRSYFYCLPEMSIVTQVTFSGPVIAPFIIVWLKETFKGSSIWHFWQVAILQTCLGSEIMILKWGIWKSWSLNLAAGVQLYAQ